MATSLMKRWPRRLALAAVTVGVIIIVHVAPAAAHVTLESIASNGDGTVTLTFTFDHGCDDSPTTELHVRLPEGVEVISTSEPEGWSAEPREGSLRWTGPPVDTNAMTRYELTTPAFGTAGEMVWFPVVQRCVEGELPWIDTDPVASAPAPFVVLDASTASDPAPPQAPTGAGGDGASSVQVWGVTLAAVVTAALVGAWIGPGRRRRRSGEG